jgi:hypothetical protein
MQAPAAEFSGGRRKILFKNFPARNVRAASRNA